MVERTGLSDSGIAGEVRSVPPTGRLQGALSAVAEGRSAGAEHVPRIPGLTPRPQTGEGLGERADLGEILVFYEYPLN